MADRRLGRGAPPCSMQGEGSPSGSRVDYLHTSTDITSATADIGLIWAKGEAELSAHAPSL